MNAHSPTAKVGDHAQRLDPLPTYDAKDLIKDGVQAQIVLGNQIYFLRITRAGKLILTK